MPESLLIRMLQVVWMEITRMWWFFLLACLLVGLIKGYKLDLKIRDALRRSGAWGVMLAVGIGLVSPLCACGILPVFADLRRQNPGASWQCPEVKTPSRTVRTRTSPSRTAG